MSDLKNWVDKCGGVKVVAKKLDVNPMTVWQWTARRGYPRVETMLKLIKLSHGELTLDSIVKSAAPRRRKKG